MEEQGIYASSCTEKSMPTHQTHVAGRLVRSLSAETSATGAAELNDETELVILSVCWNKNKLGLAVYSDESCILSIMLDVVEHTPAFAMLATVLEDRRPTNCLLSTSQDASVAKFIKIKAPETVLEFYPERLFSYAASKERLVAIPLPFIPASYTEEQRVLFLAGFDSTENILMVLFARRYHSSPGCGGINNPHRGPTSRSRARK